MDLQGAEEEAETATADMEEHEQEEQLEYGANAADIAADKMAAIVALPRSPEFRFGNETSEASRSHTDPRYAVSRRQV
eukprot:COSAG01_NODE_3106_length_6575_cov_25.785207_1_plen_78_part_00